MIYIDNSTLLENNVYRLQIPINKNERYSKYTFQLLNMQSNEIFIASDLFDSSFANGYYQFDIEFSDIPKGTYYYKVLATDNFDNNYIVTTGLAQYQMETNKPKQYNENTLNIVYQG